jgi:predicted molibdopterin-dependent oxidoreductase YjgC
LTGRRYKLPERESEGYGGREAEVKDEKIVKVTSPLDNGVTHGHLCIKGRFGWEWVNRRE